jgi:dTMP kinase
VLLEAKTDILLHRSIGRYGSLDYWESGMDLCLSPDRFESFFRYQDRIHAEFSEMASEYSFHCVDANRAPAQVHADVRRIVQGVYRDLPSEESPVQRAVIVPVSEKDRKAAAA